MLGSTCAFGQYVINGPDFDQNSPLDCNSLPAGPNFSDGAANYTPNMNEIVTYCPDLNQGSKVSVAFATNIGYNFMIDPTDTLYIYDGPNTSAPLLAAVNSGTDPGGLFVQASFENNPSGCLTFQFVSDGANENVGWDAHLGCGDLFQPFEPHIEAFKNGVGANVLNPLDTGYVDVCFGDSILFVAKPIFPYAEEVTGTGYSQTVDNVTYQWTIGGVGQFSNDSIWFTPPQRAGYFVDLRVTDIFPQIERVTCKVRVSQLPSFAGTGPLEDTVCLNENTILLGGVTASDTVGIDIPDGEFQIGGIFAGLTALPDGTGAVYDAPVIISGFDDNAVITSSADIDQLCLDIEHSYIGDIEIALTCPNGTTVSLLNANQLPGGLIPGGCGNGIPQSLGNDTDIDGGAPGANPWSYCFSVTNATYGTMCQEIAGGNFVTNDYGFQTLNNAGVFLPDGNFDDFIGCPVNGNWFITVQDNQGIDDGYIFQWGIYFNASLFPDDEGYQNYVVSDLWADDPTIVSGQNDTLIVVQPNIPGSYGYNYQVTDDYGCVYDTTVYLFVRPLPEIFNDTLACNLGFQVTGTSSYDGGEWYSNNPTINFSDSLAENPFITADNAGTYTVGYVDNACEDTVTAQIYFPPYLFTQVNDTILCNGVQYPLDALAPGSPVTYLWNTGETTQTIQVTGPGTYAVSVSNECYTYTDDAVIGYINCDIYAPNIISLSSQMGNNLWFVESEGIADFNCVIVNRWGNLIYEFNDVYGSWDGRDKSGKFVEEGTYFYRIKAKAYGGNELEKQGFIQVVH